jgi:hypothetical protein
VEPLLQSQAFFIGCIEIIVFPRGALAGIVILKTFALPARHEKNDLIRRAGEGTPSSRTLFLTKKSESIS